MFDKVMYALTDGHRRQILVELLESNSQHVGRERDRREEPGTRRYALVTYHVHLPKLEEQGFVDWNQKQGTVTRGDQFGTVRPVLEALQGRQDDLPPDYLPAGVSP